MIMSPIFIANMNGIWTETIKCADLCEKSCAMPLINLIRLKVLPSQKFVFFDKVNFIGDNGVLPIK